MSASQRTPVGPELARRLEGLLADRWGTVTVEGLKRLSGGASRETWAFDALTESGVVHSLVLQRERPGGMRAGTGMAPEARVLRAAAAGGVAVAELIIAEGDNGAERFDLGGPWLIAARVEGETIARRILREDEYREARANLATQCGAALAAIHRIPVGEAAGLEETDPVDQYRTLLDQLGQPHPVLEWALRWLDDNRPPVASTAVVHGDFRNGNLVVGPDGLRAVLDWELCHRGDPVEDLAWLCVRAWRFGAAAPVGGFGERAQLIAAYEAAGGTSVDPESLQWWEVMGTLKWGVICIVQTTTHLLGLARSVELAAIGRRVAETEHDLLELLAPDHASSDPASTAAEPEEPVGRSPHDVPSAVVLLEAVREYLSSDVSDATEGRVRFHARVASNVVAMVERELALGPAQQRAHAERLAALGVENDVAWAAGIRAGDFDGRDAELLIALTGLVADKLAVANPGYAANQ